MPTAPIKLGPFIGGVNLVDTPITLSPDELSVCSNWRIGDRGNLFKRPGHIYYGSNAAANGRINGDALVNLALRFYKASSSTPPKLVAAAGGALAFGDDANGQWTLISINGVAGSMDASNLCDWTVYKDRLYITDGAKVGRYNGSAHRFVNAVTPSAPTLTENTAGSLDDGGIYKYFVTFVRGTSLTNADLGESVKGSEATLDMAAGKTKIDLSNIPVGGVGDEVVARKIYRTEGGGSIFRFLVQLNDNTTTTYTDIISDTTLLGAPVFIPTHRPPDTARFVIMGHDDRAYYFGMTVAGTESTVEVSDVGFPDTIQDGSASFFTVANNDGDIITGGGLVPGGITFFKRNSIWLSRAFGYPLLNIQPREKRGASVGSTAPFSIVTTPIGQIFLSQRGEIYLFDGTNITEIGRKIASEFTGMLETGMARVVACYHNYRYIISYDYRGQRGYNWRTLEFDTKVGKWDGPHENDIYFTPSYYSVWDSARDKGQLAWGEAKSANGSRVYIRTEDSNTDRGNKFPAKWITGALELAKLGENKTTKIFVDAEFYADSQFEASHLDDVGNKTSVTLNTPIVTTASKWEVDPLGGVYKLGSTPPAAPIANTAKFGGITTTVLEGSFAPSARSRKPRIEVTEVGVGTAAKTHSSTIIVESLTPK